VCIGKERLVCFLKTVFNLKINKLVEKLIFSVKKLDFFVIAHLCIFSSSSWNFIPTIMLPHCIIMPEQRRKKLVPKEKLRQTGLRCKWLRYADEKKKSWKDCLSEINTFLITNILGKLEGKMSTYFEFDVVQVCKAVFFYIYC
jgi:hypothetical protein